MCSAPSQARCGDALGIGAVVVAGRVAEDVIVICHSSGKAIEEMKQRKVDKGQRLFLLK